MKIEKFDKFLYRRHLELEDLLHERRQLGQQHVPAEIATEMSDNDREERKWSENLAPGYRRLFRMDLVSLLAQRIQNVIFLLLSYEALLLLRRILDHQPPRRTPYQTESPLDVKNPNPTELSGQQTRQ